MHFWPQSGSLSEDGGATQPAAASGKPSNGGGGGSIFSQGAGMPAINSGEIMISPVEARALAALDTEPNEAHGIRRAKSESGLTDQQIKMLRRRADHARSKGITLKGPNYVRKPTPTQADTPTLIGKAAQQEQEATKEALREQARKSAYTLPEHSDFRFPAPHSMGLPDDVDSVRTLTVQGPKKATRDHVEEAEEANTSSTMAALLTATRRQRRLKRQ